MHVCMHARVYVCMRAYGCMCAYVKYVYIHICAHMHICRCIWGKRAIAGTWVRASYPRPHARKRSAQPALSFLAPLEEKQTDPKYLGSNEDSVLKPVCLSFFKRPQKGQPCIGLHLGSSFHPSHQVCFLIKGVMSHHHEKDCIGAFKEPRKLLMVEILHDLVDQKIPRP